MTSRAKKYTLGSSIFVAVLILMVIIAIALLPMGVKYYANNWLAGQGITSQIEELSIDLFDGTMKVTSLNTVSNDKRKIKVGVFDIQIRPKDLWNRKLTINRLTLSDFYLDINQKADGTLNIGGIAIGAQTDTKADKKQDEEITEAWSLSIDELVLKNIESCYTLTNNKQVTRDECMKIGQLSFKERSAINFSTAGKNKPEIELAANLSVALKNFIIYDNKNKRNVIMLQKAKFDQVNVSKSYNIKIDKIEAAKFALLEEITPDKKQEKNKQHDLFIDYISLQDIQTDAKSEFIISAILLKGIESHLTRDEQAEFTIKQRLENYLVFNNTATKENVVHSEKQSIQSPVIKIDKIRLEPDSNIHFVDKTVEPAYEGVIRKLEVDISNIDSTTANKPSNIEANFLIGDHGTVKLSGSTTLFSDKPVISIKGEIRNLDLANFASYAKQAMVHRIKSGLLDANFDYVSKSGVLDSKINLTLHKFYVDELNPEDAKKYKAKYGIVLPTALSLLREKGDVIHLNVPVTGSQDDPKFSFSKKLTELSRDAIKSTIINYYTPFGMVTTAKSAFEFVTALRFPSVTYKPGKSELTSNDKKELDKLIKLLKERPHIKLSICGQATLQDRYDIFQEEELEEIINEIEAGYTEDSEQKDFNSILPKLAKPDIKTLNDLATKRQQNIKEYITDNDIKPERLIMCNPKYSNNDTGKPRVDFTL